MQLPVMLALTALLLAVAAQALWRRLRRWPAGMRYLAYTLGVALTFLGAAGASAGTPYAPGVALTGVFFGAAAVGTLLPAAWEAWQDDQPRRAVRRLIRGAGGGTK